MKTFVAHIEYTHDLGGFYTRRVSRKKNKKPTYWHGFVDCKIKTFSIRNRPEIVWTKNTRYKSVFIFYRSGRYWVIRHTTHDAFTRILCLCLPVFLFFSSSIGVSFIETAKHPRVSTHLKTTHALVGLVYTPDKLHKWSWAFDAATSSCARITILLGTSTRPL